MLLFLPYFPKRLEHPGDALFLLPHIRVNIEIKGCSNVGMTEQYTYCLVVWLLSMQRVAKLWRSPCQSRYVETLHKSMIIVAVGAWSVIMRKANSLLTKQNIAHTLNEVGDVAEGRYDWKIDRGEDLLCNKAISVKTLL